MKAEHRKELHTNVLADRIGKVVEGIRNPPSTTSVVVWVIAGLAVVTVIAWFWFSKPSQTSAKLWAKLDADTFNKPEDYFSELNERQVLRDLDDVSQNHARTVPGRTARFQKARFLLPQGLKNVTSPVPMEAYRQLREARDLYEKLAAECGDNQVLMQEAYLGAGKAEEALVGAPDENDSKKMIGSVDRAKEFFRKARDLKPDTYLGQQAAAHYDRLEKGGEDVVKFYADLGKRKPVGGLPKGGPSPIPFPDMPIPPHR